MVVNETCHDDNYEELITKTLNLTMKHENIARYYEIAVVLVSKAKIKEINAKYRNIDEVTDVISFALFDNDDIIQNTDNITTLGDIFICVEKMQEQAKTYGHSEKRELAFLVCHGLLHLLGYDHDNSERERVMFAKQNLILNMLNLKRE